jgi:hypothetical protein
MYYPDNSERTIIKADLNWFVAWPFREGVALDPITAWLIVHSAGNYYPSAKASRDEKVVHADPYPITASGIQGCNGERYCLKSPDGSFTDHNQTWENEADLLARWPFDPQKTEAAPMERAI